MSDRSLLVTGATGAFGQAFLAHHCGTDAYRRLIAFGRSESKLAALEQTLPKDPRLRFFLGDIRDASRLDRAFRDVQVVVHAAALKRVDGCEQEPWEAVQTNVVGTQHVARACITHGIEQAVFLSTDKAPAAHTLYGATKYVAERLWVQSNVYAAGTTTRFAATRYGNVLGSTGSVVPRWRQEAASGSLTVTDPTMTRFWMTMGQAVDVVNRALAQMIGGEVFVPKLGSASLATLAQAIAPDVPLTVTGPRPGEKAHETLIAPEEARHTTDLGDGYGIWPEAFSWGAGQRAGTPLPADFTYRSDTNSHQLTVEELRGMLA